MLIIVNYVLFVSTRILILYIKDNNILFVDYRLNIAKRMLVNKKGSLIGAVLAVSIGFLVINVNFVIFQGIYDAIIRDMSDYRFGDIYVYDEERSTIQTVSYTHLTLPTICSV